MRLVAEIEASRTVPVKIGQRIGTDGHRKGAERRRRTTRCGLTRQDPRNIRFERKRLDGVAVVPAASAAARESDADGGRNSGLDLTRRPHLDRQQAQDT
jgi:hypothetical protein